MTVSRKSSQVPYGPYSGLMWWRTAIKFIIGIDLGTHTGVSSVFDNGNVQSTTVTHKSDLQSRIMGTAAIIAKYKSDDCIGVAIEQPFGAHARSLQALYSCMGAAILACEQNGLPWVLVHLAKVKHNATGKGNASKAEMIQAAKDRWGIEMDENAADASHVAAYAMDCGLFD